MKCYELGLRPFLHTSASTSILRHSFKGGFSTQRGGVTSIPLSISRPRLEFQDDRGAVRSAVQVLNGDRSIFRALHYLLGIHVDDIFLMSAEPPQRLTKPHSAGKRSLTLPVLGRNGHGDDLQTFAHRLSRAYGFLGSKSRTFPIGARVRQLPEVLGFHLDVQNCQHSGFPSSGREAWKIVPSSAPYKLRNESGMVSST